MRYRMLFVVLVLAAGLLYGLAVAQRPESQPTPTVEQAVRQATDAYAAAFNKGDVAGVLALWADDAEYVDDAGASTKGHDALAGLFRKAMAANKGVKVQIQTAAIRLVSPDVVVQDGTATLSRASGESDISPFTAVWAKTDGGWRLKLVRESAHPLGAAKDTPSDALKGLDWMLGGWVCNEQGCKTTITGRWMAGRSFLMLDYAIRRGADEVLSLTQVIGWDATGGNLHSWVFDSRGGFGEGAWSRDGNTWTAEVAGVTAAGLHGWGTHKLTFIDNDSFSFHGLDRSLDGQPLPDVKVTYHRTKKAE